MKRSIGLVRHGWEARSSARLQAATVAPPYTASLVPRPTRALHNSAHSAYPYPSLRTQAEHSLEPATPSTSRATNPPPPPPPSTSSALGKKRSSAARSTGSAQVRPGKDASKAVQTSEEKRPHPPTQSLQETSSKVEERGEARRQPTTSKADPSTSSANSETQLSSSSKVNSTSTTPGKESEPPRTLLERIKGLWENVKYLFRFYYQGTKQIWKDRAIVADLRKKVADRNAETGEGLRWIENAVIQQHESDLGKLPLFLAILLILEEILPLVVIYAPSLLPSTCILPSQNAKMRSSEERLRGLAIQDLAKNDAVRRLVDELVSSQASTAANVKAKIHDEEDVSAELSVADLGPDVGKQVSSLFALSTWGPSTMRNLRIQRHLNTVEEDDELLLNAFKTRTTTSQWKDICESDWLAKACARRGLRAFEADAKAMESNLITYLHFASAKLHINQRALLPLALYDGTMQDLVKLQGEANEEQSKGLRQRTHEVVQEVKEAEKQKEAR